MNTNSTNGFNILSAMQHRRSVRTYTDQSIDEETLGRILAAGMLAASGRGRQPWELAVVTDPVLLDKLADCRAMGSQMLRRAQAAICVFGIPEVSDTWIEDTSLVMGNMHLAADAMGLGSCWIQGRMRTASDGRTTHEFVSDLLEVPTESGLELEAVLSLGWPRDHPEPRDLANLPFSKVHLNQY